MIKVIIFDLARVILFPKDYKYSGELNALHTRLSVDSEYSFANNFYIDKETYDYIDSIRNNYSLYMFTSGLIQDTPEIKERLEQLFIKIYSAEKMGISKRDKRAYEKLLEKINAEPNEVLFVDDNLGNLHPAGEVGMKTHHFQGLDGLKKALDKN